MTRKFAIARDRPLRQADVLHIHNEYCRAVIRLSNAHYALIPK